MMKKNILISLIVAGTLATGVYAENSNLDKNTIYYPNANIKSAIAKYKAENYTGCLQELFSLTKKNPNNALAYYYMALSYSHINMKDDAIQAYEKVIELHSDDYLTEYATKGKDCLTDGPTCKDQSALQETLSDSEKEEISDLDRFIEAPYGNGLSPKINADNRKKELQKIQKTINGKNDLNYDDVQRIRNFDERKDNSSMTEETIKIAQVSDEEVLNALKTLKEAGYTLNVQNEGFYNGYQDPQMAQMSMLLGNNNNNNGMASMLPMLMSQAQKGENVDPRLMQAMMMNSMMNDFSFNTNNDRY